MLYSLNDATVYTFVLTSWQRDKAWKLFQYPCIGKYTFLDFSIGQAEEYNEVLERIKSGHKLLDLGCCFGQDVRKIVYDGAPAEKITATELERGFIEMGYELFRDKGSLTTKFIAGDFFATRESELPSGTFDIVHAASFYHLFNWDEQVEVLAKTVRLLKQAPGSMIFGRQYGVEQARELKHAATRSGSVWQHNLASFEEMVQEVMNRTSTRLQCRVSAVPSPDWYTDEKWSQIRYCIRLT